MKLREVDFSHSSNKLTIAYSLDILKKSLAPHFIPAALGLLSVYHQF